MTRLSLSAPAINNIVKALKEKGAIVPSGKRKYSYHEILSFSGDTDAVVIRFV